MRKQELDNIWAELDGDDQELLLEFAYKLQDRPEFKSGPDLKGGPYDGLRLDPTQEVRGWVNVKHGDRVVAVYVEEGGFSQDYVFARFQKTGEGCMPHVYPNRGGE